MRLVTFAASGRQRLGALIDNDRRIVDFLAAHDNAEPAFQSMQALIEGGAAALDRARELVGRAQNSGSGVIDASAIKLLAPLPTPPQLRDFLCFEKHLIQAFTQILKIRAASAPDPEQALRELEKQGAFKPPKAWYERPSFYKPSRFAAPARM
jgi:hypothetical protein